MFRGSAPLYKACWSLFLFPFLTCTWSFIPWLVSSSQLPVLVLVWVFRYRSGGSHWINYLCQSFVMLRLLWSFSLHCLSDENNLCCGSLAFFVSCSAVFKPTSTHSWWYKILVLINSCLMVGGGDYFALSCFLLFLKYYYTISCFEKLTHWYSL